MILHPSLLAFVSLALLPLLVLWQRRHLMRGVLREHTGGCEVEKFFTVPLLRQLWRRVAQTWLRGALFSLPRLAATVSDPAGFSDFPESPNVAGTRQAEETGRRSCPVGCARVIGTRQARQTGRRCCQLSWVRSSF